MGQRNIKRTRRIAREVATGQHLTAIRNYIEGIIELPFRKRLKVCWYIFRKQNPFGGKYGGKK